MSNEKELPTTTGKTASVIDAERVKMALAAQESSVRGLTFERLARALELFGLGYLREAALLWQAVRERDDTVISVTQKRDLDASLLDYEILTSEDSPEARRHQEALSEFYDGLRCTHALDRNQRGGVSLMVQQMMHSVGHKYAVHEIVWRPRPGGLSAELVFVPLQFFENTTGRLRFLASEGAWQGVPLEEGGWMVSVGPGLMGATSIAYLFKNLPLKSWLFFCQKFGIPGLHGETTASPGSEEWNRFRDALAAFAQDWALLTSAGGKINPIEVSSSGVAPHEQLVERMDRAIARIWRGADLGTMSKDGSAVGSNPQEKETDIFVRGDAARISETCQQYLDRMVIRARFGTEPLAYFSLRPKTAPNQELELKIDDALIRWGCERGQKALLEKYGRPEIAQGDTPAKAPSPAPAFGAPAPSDPADPAAQDDPEALANEQGIAQLTVAQREELQPLSQALAALDAVTTPEAYQAALERLYAEIPALYRRVAGDAALARAFESLLTPELRVGFESYSRRQTTP